MTSESARANPGNFANRSRDEVSEIGRRGGSHSHQADFRNVDAETLRRMADMRSTQSTTTAGRRGSSATQRSPTASRAAGVSAGSGAQRRSRSRSRARARSRSRSRSRGGATSE